MTRKEKPGIWVYTGLLEGTILLSSKKPRTKKIAMNMVLKRADRMEIETLVAVPADESSPAGSA